MIEMTRRQFLALSTKLAFLMGLGASAVPDIASALEKFSEGKIPILWLQGLGCSGCSVSFLNAELPYTTEIVTTYISLMFHSTISTATGEVAVDAMNKTIEQGGYYLIVEGGIPSGMPKACRIGDETVNDQVLRASANSKAVVSVGTCATFGGIPAGEGNPTGAIGVPEFLSSNKITVPVISLPGCPAHPDWIMGTIVHVLKFGIPDLDSLGRPLMFYDRTVHDRCNRFSDYERQKFAKSFSDDGCLFKLGCLGPITNTDCPVRLWNGHTNFCIKAKAPCIGCSSKSFASSSSFPFYLKKPRTEG